MEGTEMKAVIVTTEFRGVFFGRLAEEDSDKRIVKLEGARNVIYWPAATRGFIGLATEGPIEGAKIGPACERITLWGVTSVLECSETAVKRFEEIL